jgi:hypothetical protein
MCRDPHLAPRAANHRTLSPLDFLDRAVGVHPIRLAVVWRDQRFSYAGFGAIVARMADYLRARGIGVGDVVSVMLPNRPEMLAAHYAVPMVGAVLNAINTRLDVEAVSYILTHAESRLLIACGATAKAATKAASVAGTACVVLDAPGSPDFLTGEATLPLDLLADIADEWQPLALTTDSSLPDLAPEDRRAIWMGLADALSALHNVDPAAVGLADFGRPGNYFDRQITRWTKQWKGSSSAPIPDLDAVADWLPAHLPPDDGAASLAHGDFRLGNMLYHPTEPRVVAILDWELSTLGHPLADLGFCVMPWHTTPDEYGGLLGLDLATLGLPTEADVVARYMRQRPVGSPLLPFHKVFALFRFAVIFVGISDRVRNGTAAAEDADSYAPLAARFARRARDLILQTDIILQTEGSRP